MGKLQHLLLIGHTLFVPGIFHPLPALPTPAIKPITIPSIVPSAGGIANSLGTPSTPSSASPFTSLNSTVSSISSTLAGATKNVSKTVGTSIVNTADEVATTVNAVLFGVPDNKTLALKSPPASTVHDVTSSIPKSSPSASPLQSSATAPVVSSKAEDASSPPLPITVKLGSSLSEPTITANVDNVLSTIKSTSSSQEKESNTQSIVSINPSGSGQTGSLSTPELAIPININILPSTSEVYGLPEIQMPLPSDSTSNLNTPFTSTKSTNQAIERTIPINISPSTSEVYGLPEIQIPLSSDSTSNVNTPFTGTKSTNQAIEITNVPSIPLIDIPIDLPSITRETPAALPPSIADSANDLSGLLISGTTSKSVPITITPLADSSTLSSIPLETSSELKQIMSGSTDINDLSSTASSSADNVYSSVNVAVINVDNAIIGTSEISASDLSAVTNSGRKITNDVSDITSSSALSSTVSTAEVTVVDISEASGAVADSSTSGMLEGLSSVSSVVSDTLSDVPTAVTSEIADVTSTVGDTANSANVAIKQTMNDGVSNVSSVMDGVTSEVRKKEKKKKRGFWYYFIEWLKKLFNLGS